ncbi:MAG: hypothetical protein ABI072_05430 [Edaphobacter sp.]
MKAAAQEERVDLKVEIANGAAAAAILSAGIGCFALGVLTVVGDGSKLVAKLLTFYTPSGPLSGVSTVAMRRVNMAAFVLLGAGLLLTFPPFGDLLLGR